MLIVLSASMLALPVGCKKDRDRSSSTDGSASQTASASASRPAPVDEMLALKQIRYSDEEIIAAVLPEGQSFTASPADLKRLREAGFGEAILNRLSPLQAAAPAQMTNQQLARMAETGQQTMAMLEAVATRGGSFDTSAGAMLELKRQGVPQIVLLAVRRQSVTADQVTQLHRDGAGEAELLKLMEITGTAAPGVDIATAREMIDAGVPTAVIARLKQPAGPTVTTPVATGSMGGLMATPTEPTATPAPAPTDGDATIGANTPVNLPAAPRSGAGGLSADGQTYTHPLGVFTLPVPGHWRVMRESNNGTAEMAITPDRQADSIKTLPVAVQVVTFRLPADSPFIGQDARNMLDQLLPIFQQDNPQLKRVGGVEAATLSGLPAGRQKLRGRFKDKTGQYQAELYMAAGEDNQMVLVGVLAPADQFSRYQPTFRQVLDGLRVTGFRGPKRKATPYNAADLCEQYKTSVVSVCTEEGYGTGMIVSEDGYVVTNAHVILKDMNKQIPSEKIWVDWDSDLNLPRLEAKLVAWRFEGQKHGRDSHRSLTLHGEDTALLKIPAVRKFKPVKITPLSMVRLGDPVVTMGFPTRSSFSTLSRVITNGVVSRFNKDASGVVRSIYIDAATTHGSSGGPCFSLATGGVIGQSTFGVDPELAQMWGFRHKNLENYFGVIQSDYLLNSYPVATGFCQSDQPDAFDYFSAAAYCLERKNYRTAKRLAREAVEMDRRDPDNHWILGRAQLYGANDKKDIDQAALSFQEALRLDAKHSASMRSLVELNLIRGDNAKAIKYADGIVEAFPEQFFAHITRAEFHLQMGAWEEALADLEKAKSLCSTMPTPYILAGKAQYGLEKYDLGKADFEKALQQHPQSLQARLGLAQYDVYTDDLPAAILKYLRLDRDFSDSPVVALELGFCYKQQQQWDKAANAYLKAIRRMKQNKLFAPPVVYYDAGQYLFNAARQREALNLYAEALLEYPEGEYAAMMFAWSGAIFHKEGISDALALGNLKLANNLKQTQQVTDLLNKVKDAKFSLKDLDTIKALGYPPRMARVVIANVPLGFKLNKDLVAKIVQLLSPEIAEGVIISHKRFKPKKPEQPTGAEVTQGPDAGPQGPGAGPQGPGGGPQGPGAGPQGPGGGGQQPPQQKQRPQGMVGVWECEKQMPNGMTMIFRLQLRQDGQFMQVGYANGQVQQQLAGEWWIEGNNIVYQVQGMQPEAYAFGCDGQTLQVDYGEGAGVAVYQRIQ
jgi:tetratricopeptide (TPR) repeat protein